MGPALWIRFEDGRIHLFRGSKEEAIAYADKVGMKYIIV